MLAAVMLWGLSWLASCTDNSDNPCGGSMDYSTSLFVATDRHEAGRGNNLTAMLARAVAGSGIRPQTVLLGGDYVGGRGDMTPEFTIKDLYDEVYAIVDPLNTRVMMTYGSHDDNCTEGYNAFYSGPRRCNGYYTYGICYVQMVAVAVARLTDRAGCHRFFAALLHISQIGKHISQRCGLISFC